MPHTTRDSTGRTVHDRETIPTRSSATSTGSSVPSTGPNAPSTGSTAGTGKAHDAMRSVRGVAEVIHGYGENIRGTALGTLDKLSKDKNTGHEEIAERGRLETQRGMTDLGRGPAAGQTPHGVQPASSYPTQASHGSHGLSTGTGTTESNRGAFQEGTSPALYTSQGTGTGLGGHPETARSEYADPYDKTGQIRTTTDTGAVQYPVGAGAQTYGTTGSASATQGLERHPETARSGYVDPNATTGQTRTTTDTGAAQYPVGAGAQPYGTTGSASATQEERQPSSRQFGGPNEQGSMVGGAGPEPTIYPGPGSGPGHHREDVVVSDKPLPEVQPAASQQHPYNPAQNPNVSSVYGNDSYPPTSAANQERR